MASDGWSETVRAYRRTSDGLVSRTCAYRKGVTRLYRGFETSAKLCIILTSMAGGSDSSFELWHAMRTMMFRSSSGRMTGSITGDRLVRGV